MEWNIYGAALLASIIMVILLIYIGHRQNITYYLLMFVTIMISNMGYYTISIAESFQTAVLGHQMVYLGGVFVPLLMLLCAMKLCRIEIPRLFVSILLFLCIVVLYFAFSVQYRTDFYESLALRQENGMTYLVKEYGPMHKLYIGLLLSFVAITLSILVYAFFKKKVSHQIIVSLMCVELVPSVCYLWKRITGANMEWLAVAYVLSDILILLQIRKIGMYEVSENIANSLNEHSTYGYLVFDKNRRYVGCNYMAEEYWPEIKEQRIDTVLTEEKTPLLYQKFGKWMEQPEQEKSTWLVEKGDKVLKCSGKNLYYGRWKKKIGYLIELVDDTQQQKYLQLMSNYNANLAEEVHQKTEHINRLQEKIVLGMADMIESRDSNTGGHTKRTSKVIRIFITELQKFEVEYGFSKEFLDCVAKAAPMHDLGKIAVPDQILRKPGKYTPEEFAEMKKHSEKGAEIVSQILDGVEDEKFVQIAKNVAHYHHEKWNGQGYPEGLEGLDIPPEARIMAVADVFDALVSKRCYKDKMDYDDAFKIIEESLGTHFDPELGKLFLRCRPLLEEFYNSVEMEQ